MTAAAHLRERHTPPHDRTLRYGPLDDHVADVWLPSVADPVATVLFLHGGFWRQAYDRRYSKPLAHALSRAGYVAVNVEYRRVGGAGGYPQTFDDVACAVDSLPAMLVEECGVHPAAPLLIAGHSAGGHLALWASARHRLPASSPWHTTVMVDGALALAGVCSVTAARADKLGDGAASELLGPECDLTQTDPGLLGSTGVPTALVHGRQDDRVPFSYSVSHQRMLAGTGSRVQLYELLEAGHFEVIDPRTEEWSTVLGALEWLID